ncbi:terminase small subunit [uncultured Methylophaga sp.]|uniref:terminase small subunit n=1 Tax=uncultured Methylophaga sp. TaxID=285271 RepID=UPI002628CB7B|nr:terminase small subunit [uncultured Methylophaga sp.]|tara:strand:- start:369 stop:911 length:543 start_codon:yes stop_codon:yes gene_type:complete
MMNEQKVSSLLTPRQLAFIDEYLIDFNGAQAAIRAGYSHKTAGPQAARLLVNVNISRMIAERIEARNKRLQIDSEYVLKRLIEIDQMDLIDIFEIDGHLKSIDKWPAIWRQMIQGLDVSEITSQGEVIGLLKKVKWPDKLKNLELLGKHTNIGAWEKKVELNQYGQKTISELLIELARDS